MTIPPRPPANTHTGSTEILDQLETDITRLRTRVQSLAGSISALEQSRPGFEYRPRPPSPYAPGFSPNEPLAPAPPAFPAYYYQPPAARPAPPPPPQPPASTPPAVPARWLLGEQKGGRAAARPVAPAPATNDDAEPDAAEPTTVTVCFEPVADITEAGRLQHSLSGLDSVLVSSVKRVGHGLATFEIQAEDPASLAQAFSDPGFAKHFSDHDNVWHVVLAQPSE